jgi:hypothetical protein
MHPAAAAPARRLIRPRLRAVLSAAIAVTVLLGCLGGAAAQARTYIPDGGHLRFKPHSFRGGSGVGGGVFTAKKLHWTRYRNTGARATGKVVVNICDPTCADGNMRTFKADFHLYRSRRHCKVWNGTDTVAIPQRVFTRVDIVVTDSSWAELGGSNPWKTMTEAGQGGSGC